VLFRSKQVAARVLEEETKRLTLEKEALERELTAKLQLATKEHGTEKEQLTQEILKLQQQLEELGAEREKVIRQLQESVQSKAQEYELAVKELKDEKDSLADENARLNQENIFHQDENEQLRQEKATLEEILSSDIELQCQSIIREKLIPLTKNYLVHLAREVQKSIDDTLNISANNVSDFIAEVNRIRTWPSDEASKNLKQKFDAVSGLYATLQDKKVIRPSEKMTKFYEQLNDADEVIKMHRDPAWKRYTANAVAVLGIILTGILPGLAVLGIIALSGRSPKFWESAGQTFFTSTVKEVESNIPPSTAPKAVR